MADDDLDALYRVQPDAFIGKRTKLATAAQRRGDPDTAKQISAARKPTAAAWIVNRLALQHKDVKPRLADLGDRLRAAHAAMDGDTIRELSAEQHRVVAELARAAFKAADVNPSSAVRDDVTNTLQAAVADPDVGNRLGRLARPERFSGFGTFGEAATDPAESQKGKGESPRPTPVRSRDKDTRQRREKLRAALTAAEQDKAEADTALSEQRAERDTARRRRDEASILLRRAERELRSAEGEYERAKQASSAAADSVNEAKAQMKRA